MRIHRMIREPVAPSISLRVLCPISEQSHWEERINTWTHGLGALLSLVGFVALAIKSAKVGQNAHILGCSIYATTLVMVYVSSTLYHHTPTSLKKQWFRMADHICIYFLIAGSYTPFALFVLAPEEGLPLLWLLWGMTLFGMICKLLAKSRHPLLSTGFYLAMGWCGMWVVGPLKLALSPLSYDLLVWGGLLYSLGTLFYAWKQLPFHHGIWHLFVLAASGCHFFSIYLAI